MHVFLKCSLTLFCLVSSLQADVEKKFKILLSASSLDAFFVGEGRLSPNFRAFNDLISEDFKESNLIFRKLASKGLTAESRCYGLLGLKLLKDKKFREYREKIDTNQKVRLRKGSLIYKDTIEGVLKSYKMLVKKNL